MRNQFFIVKKKLPFADNLYWKKRSLAKDIANRQTYMSRNGGLDWFKIGEHINQFDVTDWGAITIVAHGGEETNTFRFSLNEGVSWTSCTIQNSMMVDNVLPNTLFSGTQSQELLMYGTRIVNGVEKGNARKIQF